MFNHMLDEREMHPMCIECKRLYVEKYSKEKVWKICSESNTPCKGVRKKLGLTNSEKDKLKSAGWTDDDILEYEIATESIIWAKRYLNWDPRWYQENMLRCKAIRKVMRCGRRVGKTAAMTIDMLHYTFTTPGVTALLATPYKAQIELVWKEINKNLKNGMSIVKHSILKIIKNPYELHWNNGSKIIAFTLGSKSGGKGDVARGQHADRMYFDEVDYMNREDVETLYVILQDNPKSRLWASSTPTGKHELYWEFCLQKPHFKEFYYPASVNPNWGPALEREFRDMYSGEAYKHEICLAENTLILTKDGNKPIQNITENDIVFDHNGNEISVIKGAVKTGTKKTVSCHLPYNNFYVQSTPDHGFPNRDFVKTPISELSELPVYRNKNYNMSSKELIMARLIGYNLGNGTVNSTIYQSSFYYDNKIDMDRLIKDIRYLYPNYKRNVIENMACSSQCESRLANVNGMRYSVNVSVNITKDLLKHGAIRGKKIEKEFRVPWFVRRVKKWVKNRYPAPIYTIPDTESAAEYRWIPDIESLNIKREFISALFGAKGITPPLTNGYNDHTVSLSMCKRTDVDGSQFFDDLVDILKHLNIRSVWTSTNIGNNTLYYLYIYNDIDNIIKFYNIVGYRYAENKENLAFYWSCYLGHYKWELKKKQDMFNKVRSLRNNGIKIDDIVEKTNLSEYQVCKAIYNRKPNRLYNEFMKFDEWMATYFHNGAIFLPFREPLYYHKTKYDTYNITVDSEDHSYLLANGIRTFNCAEFGNLAEGVFQNQYIDNSLQTYFYTAHKDKHTGIEYDGIVNEYNPENIYGLGADWNGVGAGCHFVIVEWNKELQKYRLFWKEILKIEEMTHRRAVSKVIELNDRFNPDIAFVDQGYGHKHVEDLKQYGIDHPGCGLHKKLTGVRFGDVIEIRDPFTREIVKSPVKHFMVTITQRLLEAGNLILPEIEDDEDGLVCQMRGYIVDRYSQDGRPIYAAGKSGDHTLDAFMLALYGIATKFTNILTTYSSNKIDIITSGLPNSRIEEMTVNRWNESEIKRYSSFGVKRRKSNIILPKYIGTIHSMGMQTPALYKDNATSGERSGRLSYKNLKEIRPRRTLF